MPVNLIVGNDGSNSLQGTAGADVIYGYNPDGPQSNASTITATRVASGLNEPVFTGAPAGDPGRLFIVEKTELIKVLDLNTGQVLATPFLDVSSQILTDNERGPVAVSPPLPLLPPRPVPVDVNGNVASQERRPIKTVGAAIAHKFELRRQATDDMPLMTVPTRDPLEGLIGGTQIGPHDFAPSPQPDQQIPSR